MAELRIPPTSQLPAARPAAPGPRAEAVRAAQQAFFRAALGQAEAPAPVSAPEQSAAPSGAKPPPDPQRPLRPGSLVDIKV